MVTPQMAFNMVGQAAFQVVVVLAMLFNAHLLPTSCADDDSCDPATGKMMQGSRYSKENNNAPSEHYTFIFNVFVYMQLFNEINSRKLFWRNQRVRRVLCQSALPYN